MKEWVAVICFFLFMTNIDGQSFYFGPKAGIGINTQKWGNFQRDPLLTPFGDIFIESYDENSDNSLFASLGYHTRGSALQLFSFNNGTRTSDAFRFNNIVLIAAAKQGLSSSEKSRPYYLLGIRAEYTVGTNLDEFGRFQSAFYPIEFYVNKFNYGFTVGGGWEFNWSELYGGFLEIALHPDVSKQYDQPPIPNVVNPYNGRSFTLPERQIRNLSLEVTFGLRFLRKVEYID